MNNSKKKSKEKKEISRKKLTALTTLTISVGLLLAAAIIIVMMWDKLPFSNANEDNYAELLPTKERPSDKTANSDGNETSDGQNEFRIKGIVFNSFANSSCIIENAGKVYVLSLNEIIGNTGWYVAEIGVDYVGLCNGEQSVTLNIDDKGGMTN